MDAESEEEKPSDEHGASHAGHVGQDSQEERQRQAPEYHQAEKLEEESEALAARTLMRQQATPSRSRTNAPATTGEEAEPYQGGDCERTEVDNSEGGAAEKITMDSVTHSEGGAAEKRRRLEEREGERREHR